MISRSYCDTMTEVKKRFDEWRPMKDEGCRDCTVLFETVAEIDQNTTYTLEKYIKAYESVLKFGIEHYAKKEHKT